MALEFDCPACGQRYKVAAEFAGREFACRGCGTLIAVPSHAAPVDAFLASPIARESSSPVARESAGHSGIERPYLSPKAIVFDEFEDGFGAGDYARSTREKHPAPQYAGFWIRFVAVLIDAFVIGILVSLVAGALFGSWMLYVLGTGRDPDPLGIILLAIAIFFAVVVIRYSYPATMVGSRRQATIGKMAMGIIVTDLEGRPLSFWRSLGRELCKIVTSMVPFGIGFLLAAFTEQKQALHDMIASTLVVKKR